MKKKYLSVLVIVVTLILVIFMIKGKENDNGYTMVKKEKEINLEEGLTNSSKVDNNKELNDFINNLESNGQKEKTASDDKAEDLKKENNNIEDKEKEIQQKSMEDNININNDSYKEYEINKNSSKIKEVIFKVDKEKIISKMSNEDRKTLIKMVKKLSMYDYARMMNTIKENGEEEAALDVLEILTKRLNNEEYNKVKGILNPYINIDLLEEKSL